MDFHIILDTSNIITMYKKLCLNSIPSTKTHQSQYYTGWLPNLSKLFGLPNQGLGLSYSEIAKNLYHLNMALPMDIYNYIIAVFILCVIIYL